MTPQDIKANIIQKYADAVLLEQNGRYSNAIYLFGYCAELSLKLAIITHLKWNTLSESCFYTHKLNFLYKFTGKGENTASYPPLNSVKTWNEAYRYQHPSAAKDTDCAEIHQAIQQIAADLCEISLP